MQLTIDNHAIHVPSVYTLLQAARDAKRSIHIPTLCYLESLAPYAACRVMDATDAFGKRINGRLVSAYPFESVASPEKASVAIR